MSRLFARTPLLIEGQGLEGSARARAMFAVALSVLLSVLDYAIANVALPTIADDLHADRAASIWVVNAYQMASVMALLPLASLGARVGFARMCQIGIGVFVVASVWCATAHSLLEISLARALQGIGGACIMSVNIALVRFIYPHAAIGRGIAINGIVVAAGVALGPTIAALVLYVARWPWIFLINLPLGAVALFFAVTTLPRTPRVETPFDWRSAALNVVAFSGVIVGIDSLAHQAGAAQASALIVVGAVALAALVLRQRGRPNPMFPVDLLGVPDFVVAFLVGMMGFIASNFFIISMPFTLQSLFGRTPSQTGLLITPWPVGIVLISPLVGRIADRVPASVVSSCGLLVTSFGFLMLSLLPADATTLDIIWRIGIAGMGFGIFQAPNNRAMMVAAPRGRAGSASGMVSVARLMGQTLGAMLVALTFAFVAQQANRRCLEFASVTALLAAILSATRLRRRAAH
ncbi:transporter [Ameyamaea chiangmaiensis NBRC 103196]|uniref:MFS transporter n=1 Tax=Ameyamaea chiangmaiensis TaxID=442969 RepID=A0A850PD07_9PROT|nr:MFS transporter [Ameyamaea chiangmaiensis]MBS4074907.1 MFS transporter [Ameyamaea chiangmaiensis]NVN40783.1 MFS transporter [Ameyamaea chiangmaiensis]GBQ63182.1 transporter [Ameyamaea chiangmaiensis NBRC 103196]